MSKSKTIPQGRPLPPNYKFCMRANFCRKLKWKERIQALFGYTVKLDLRIATEHSTGRFHPELDLAMTAEIPAQLQPPK